MKRLAVLLCMLGLAACSSNQGSGPFPGAQGGFLFSSACATSPQMGGANNCADTTLGGVGTWNGTLYQPSQAIPYKDGKVGSLPTCNAAAAGMIATVNDSTAVSSEGQACTGSSTHAAVAICGDAAWHCF